MVQRHHPTRCASFPPPSRHENGRHLSIWPMLAERRQAPVSCAKRQLFEKIERDRSVLRADALARERQPARHSFCCRRDCPGYPTLPRVAPTTLELLLEPAGIRASRQEEGATATQSADD